MCKINYDDEYIGWISWVHQGMFSTSGDTMSTSGDIMSPSGGCHEYIGVFNRN